MNVGFSITKHPDDKHFDLIIGTPETEFRVIVNKNNLKALKSKIEESGVL